MELNLHKTCQEDFHLGYIIKTLVRNIKEYTLMAYKGLKERREYIVGLENGRAGQLKKRLLLALVDKNFFFMMQGWNKLREHNNAEELMDEYEEELRTRKMK